MSRLDTILNPEDSFVGSPRQIQAAASIKIVSSPSSSASGPLETTPCDRPYMAAEPHHAHPSCPNTLSCLPDTDGRPQHTLPVILRCAILGSAKGRLTIRDIYKAMEEKYPYYKTAGQTWKQSVRHHLSLNRLFERQPRPVTDPGFGSYWTVNLEAPPGTKRPRKRGRPQSQVDDFGDPQPPKKRGRPRKNPIPSERVMASTSSLDHPPIATISLAALHKRVVNRPKVSALRASSQDQLIDDDDDDETMADVRSFRGTFSRADKHTKYDKYDDDYESEEDMDLEPKLPSSERGHPLKRKFAELLDELPDFPSNALDRMKIEMAGLRRQSADAMSVSLRMSDQLAEAQADASRARAALRMAESMLEDEARKRQEAERLVDDEARARRRAEDFQKRAEEALVNLKAEWDQAMIEFRKKKEAMTLEEEAKMKKAEEVAAPPRWGDSILQDYESE